MQPPPRKVKYTTALKNVHSEHVSRLQVKVQQDCELLDDIRNFSRQRSIIEKEYGQALLKLTTGLLKREFQATPDLPNEDGVEYKTALEVWRKILEETEKLAKARLQAAEIFNEKISEPVKPLKSSKLQAQKKVIPQLSQIQNEVGHTVLEMAKAQKLYNVEETLAHDARVKADDASQRLAKKSTGLFQSITSLQQKCAKLTARKDAYNAKSVLSRNDYLLHIAAANAHQSRYYNTDLTNVFKALDVEMYEKILEFFHTMGNALLDVSSLEKSASETIVQQSDMIDREFNHKCFMYCNPVFSECVQYEFHPCQNDQCNKLSSEHNAGHQLDKEARKWATKIAKENRTLREHRKTLQALENQFSGDKASDSSTSEVQELENKIDEMKQHIRKAEIGKCKAEARIELLRSKVNVEEWLASAQAESLRAEEEEQSLRSSQGSVFTDSSGGKSDDLEPTYTNYANYDDDDFIDDTFEMTKEQSVSSYDTNSYTNHSSSQFPMRCRALYDFQGSNADELNLTENEELEIISDGDGDGWVRARNMDGHVGYIPHNYIQMLDSGGDIDIQQHHDIPTNGSNNDYVQEVTSYSSGDIEVQMTTDQMPVDNNLPLDDGNWARALYDYDACSEEELSFIAGTLIKILRKDENGVDDGFWEGELNGRIGVFPALVVEELGADSGSDLMSPDAHMPPPEFFPPPPVTITAATPETEQLPPMDTGYSLRRNCSNGYDQGNQKRVWFDMKGQNDKMLMHDHNRNSHSHDYKKYNMSHDHRSHRNSHDHIQYSCRKSHDRISEFDVSFDEDGEESFV